ncbi:MAG: cache domain-containing protein [Chloroflexota bacterium]
MILTRRLLIPILAWVTVIVVALVATGLFFSQRSSQATETASMASQVEVFYSRLESLKNFALALATETANNPEVQAAFAAGNRKKLTDLTLPGYLAVDAQFDVPQAQFHLPPATSFLRLHQLENFGDDLSAFRFTVLAANAEKLPTAGVEMGRGGLGMRGVVPVFYKNLHVGTVEYGLNIDRTLLAQLADQFGDDWQILLLREPAEIATFAGAVGETEGPTPDFILQASTLDEPFYDEAEAYIQAKNGQTVTTRLRADDKAYIVISAPIFDYSGQVIGILNVIRDRTADARSTSTVFITIIFSSILGVALGGYGLFSIARRILHPIAALTETATMITEGNLEIQADTGSPDEIGLLGKAFNAMTYQLKTLIESLEVRIQDRTRDLARSAEKFRLVAAVASSTASIQELKHLLATVSEIISERFNIYHVGIFLLDEEREFAVLEGTNSLGGQKMLEHGHKLKVGAQGIVGYVTGTGSPRIALDVGSDATYFDNPDLPNTRSEMALPLKIAGEIIGALDLQSVEPDAFSEADIEVLSILADQVAIAIQNARSFENAGQAIREAEIAFQQVTGQTWQQFAKEKGSLGYVYDGLETRPLKGEANGHDAQEMRIPVKLRGKTIGTLKMRAADPGHSWSDDEIAMAEAASERAALALENARLLEDSQKRAAKEQTISQASARIGASLDFGQILSTTAKELEQALGSSEIVINLEDRD